MPADAETLDTAGCAQLLLCGAETVEELARKGELPGIKIGRAWLFVKADLLAYLAERGRLEAEERRQALLAKTKTPAPVARLVKQRRQTPPTLPQPATAVLPGLRLESSRSAAP